MGLWLAVLTDFPLEAAPMSIACVHAGAQAVRLPAGTSVAALGQDRHQGVIGVVGVVAPHAPCVLNVQWENGWEGKRLQRGDILEIDEAA